MPILYRYILSCGAGMQSTALALMSCQNKLHGKPYPWPKVPIYDLIIFCDLGLEPPWVYDQVAFIQQACRQAGIKFVKLPSPLYKDYIEKYGYQYLKPIPFYTFNPTTGEDGMYKRVCTIVYKIQAIQRYVRGLLGYGPERKLNPLEYRARELHIGFSAEEFSRVFASKNNMFINVYPLVEMGLERKDTYRYNLEQWGLDSKASACSFCPYHRNYFFEYLKTNHPANYSKVIKLDKILESRAWITEIKSNIFISRSCKRLERLTHSDCLDAQTFQYRGKDIWNGF